MLALAGAAVFALALILDWADAQPTLDGARVALLGVSFGGAQVIGRASCRERV